MSGASEPVCDPATRADAARIVTERGFSALPALETSTSWFEGLVAEASAARSEGWANPSGETVDHRAFRGPIGPLARDYLSAPATLALIADVVGEEVTPSFEGTCFTYYEGPGDFLGRHRDRPGACAFTLILYLEATWPEGRAPGRGLDLQVWRGPDGEELLATLPTRAGGIVVGRGSEVFHGRPALAEGESVWALTACYASAAAVDRTAEDEAARLCEEGEANWRQGDAAAAVQRFQHALTIAPEDDRAWAGLGFARWAGAEFEGALDAFQRAAGSDSQNPSHWSNIGLCLRDLRRPDNAIAAFRVSLLLDPGYAPAWNEWGNVLQDEGRVEEALPYYARALGLDPSRAVVHHNLGVAHARMGHDALAADAFLAALERDPRYAHSREEFALLLERAGRRTEALEVLSDTDTARAREIETGLSSSHRSTGEG